MTEWTFHGGRLAQARKRFGEGEAPWIDLSTGINPHPWPNAERVAIDWGPLPDTDALRDLEKAAADFFGADPACVAALPGTEIGLRLLGEHLPRPVHYCWPSYRTHAELAPNAIAVAPDALPDIAGGTLILANPNNPDGRVFTSEALGGWVRGSRWLVIDEAFADADPRHSLAGQVHPGQPLVVLRSFGKFFGLAGLRLGFVTAPPPLIETLRAQLGAWPLSAAAIAIGAAAYRDTAWIAETRAKLPREAAALDAILSCHGLMPIGACPLFRLVETPDAHTLFDRLARRSILTRPFDYDRRWLRIGLPPDAAALARLDATLGDG